MIMPVQPVGPDWKVVASLWKQAHAKAFLSDPPPDQWPERGPLSQFLERTKKICSSPPETYAKDPRAARQAVKSEIVLTLTQIICWLQQRPCYGRHVGARAEAIWGSFLGALANVVYSVSATLCTSTLASDRALATCCMEQLMQAPGAFFPHGRSAMVIQVMLNP